MGRCFYSNYNDYLLYNRVRVVSLSIIVIFRFQSKAYTLMRFAFLFYKCLTSYDSGDNSLKRVNR